MELRDRTLHVGGIPSAVVLDASGKLDTSVGENGCIALPNDTVASQFSGAALLPHGRHIALTTNNNAAGARLVVLGKQD